MDSEEQTVMTIFYDVDPCDVRNQTGDFGNAFKRTCLGKTADEKLRWKKALTDVANIVGEHSKNWFVFLTPLSLTLLCDICFAPLDLFKTTLLYYYSLETNLHPQKQF